MEQEEKSAARQRIVWGVILVAIGAVVLADRGDLLELHTLWHHWPLLLVLVGVTKIIGARVEDIFSGLWLVFVGAWLYVSVRHLWGLSFRDTWPFVLIAWGIGQIARPYVLRALQADSQ